MIDKRTGESIRHTRKGLGLSGREVAKRARISAAYLCDIELGRRRVPHGTMERIRAGMKKARVVKSHGTCETCSGTGLSEIPLMLVA